MTVRFYLDQDAFRYGLVEALRRRAVDLLSPLEVDMLDKSDEEPLNYAAANGRAIYTFNIRDFCRLHAEWMAAHKDHAGIIQARQQTYSVGDQTRRLMKLMAARSADQMRNRTEFLSNWG